MAVFIREAPGLIAFFAYFIITPLILKLTVCKKIYNQLGKIRYAVFCLLLMCMIFVPIKMLMRWLFDLKYIVAFPEWNLNI